MQWGISCRLVLAEPGNTGLTDDDTEEAWGLAAIAPQAASNTVYMGHYAVNQDWWTLFALANIDDVNLANVTLVAYGNDGTVAGVESETINPKGRWAELVEDLFFP